MQDARKKDVQVLAMDFMEEPKHVKEYMAEKGINYPVAIIDESVSTTFGEIEGIPTSFVIDPQGKIVKVLVGYADKSDIEGYIK